VRGEVGEDRDQFGRVAAPRVVDLMSAYSIIPLDVTTYRAGMVNLQLGSPFKAARSMPQCPAKCRLKWTPTVLQCRSIGREDPPDHRRLQTERRRARARAHQGALKTRVVTQLTTVTIGAPSDGRAVAGSRSQHRDPNPAHARDDRSRDKGAQRDPCAPKTICDASIDAVRDQHHPQSRRKVA